MSNTLDRSLLFAFANVAQSSTDSVIVAASGTAKIRVLGVVVVEGDTAGSAITFNSKPAGAGTAISATFKPGANGGFTLPVGGGWFQTLAGQGLTVTTGAGSATAVAVQVTYALVPT